MRVCFWLAFVFVVADAVSAAPRVVKPLPLQGQELVYENGQAFLLSRGQRATIVLSPESIDSKRVWIALSFMNSGDRAFLVTEVPVRVTSVTTAGNRPVSVLGRTELEKAEKRRQMWENIGAGLAAGLNAYSAGQQGHSTSTTYHSGSATAYGNNGGYAQATYSGTSTTYHYDAAAAQAAHMRAATNTQNMMNAIQAERQARQSALESSVLQNHTLAAGQQYSGRVQIELPRKKRNEGQAIELIVSAGGEEHPFLLLADGALDPNVESRVLRSLGVLVPPPPRAVAAELAVVSPDVAQQVTPVSAAQDTDFAAVSSQMNERPTESRISVEQGDDSVAMTTNEDPAKRIAALGKV